MGLTAAQRGAVDGKDGLSLDLNDSVTSEWTSGVLFHVIDQETGHHCEEAFKRERSQSQDEPATDT